MKITIGELETLVRAAMAYGAAQAAAKKDKSMSARSAVLSAEIVVLEAAMKLYDKQPPKGKNVRNP